MTTAADHEATVAARNEELKVIATAEKILKDSTSGAVGQTYSFLQTSMQTRADLANSEVVTMVKNLARNQHSAALAQLASRISVVVKYGGGADVFGKVKGLISEMITKLTNEIDRAASQSAARKGEVKALEADLAELAKTQAEMDSIRRETQANFDVAQAELTQGLTGVRKALGVLREYYGGAAAFMQQPAAPQQHAAASGAGGSIINILE